MILGSDRIPESRHTAASATKAFASTRSQVSANLQTFSAFNIAKETLFIDLTLCENRNWGENGSLAIVTA